MKTNYIVLLVLLALWHVPAVQSADLKIGTVNVAKILNQSPQADQANKRLQREFEPRQKALQDTEKNLRSMQERLENPGTAEGQRRNLERDFRTQSRDFQRSMGEFREDLNIRRNQEIGKFQQQVLDTVGKLAKEEGYDLILNEGAIVYAGQSIDITDKVLARLGGK